MANSRERLHQTLNHIEPEELVVDMGATPITGINANALNRLRKAIGLEEAKWRRISGRRCIWIVWRSQPG